MRGLLSCDIDDDVFIGVLFWRGLAVGGVARICWPRLVSVVGTAYVRLFCNVRHSVSVIRSLCFGILF